MTDPTTPPARVTPIQADIKAARAAQVDLLIGGVNGDKEAWRRVEERFAAHRLAALSEREQVAREYISPDLAEVAGIVAAMHTKWMQRGELMRQNGGFEMIEKMADLMDGIVDAVPELQRKLFAVIASAPAAPKAEDHPVAGEDEALEPDPDCEYCFGSGSVESGGDEPHTAFSVACVCMDPANAALAHPAPDALADDDIETLLRDIEAMGDWEERHDEILERWRQRRGEAGMDGWRWWWRPDGDDRYWTDHDTREQAIQAGIDDADSHAYGEDIEIIEARCWADDIDVENARFADTRNHERLSRSLLATEGR